MREKEPPGAWRFNGYVLGSAVLHAVIFAVASFRSARAALPAESGAATFSVANIDVEWPIPDPPATPVSGGGPATARDPKDASPRPVRTASARTPAATPKPRAAQAARDDAAPASPTTETAKETLSPDDAEIQMSAERAALERRERAVDMAAAAAAAGAGPGAGGGPGGLGEGRGIPVIRKSIAFGNASHGALTGRVCFLPVGTMRIADVRDCQYVATFYTDTLDIPERHFSDGFPGVTSRSDWFLIDYTGAFTVSQYGSYEFRLHSDDGSYLYIDDQLVIDNDGKHAPESRRGTIALFAGAHRIKVRYAQTDDRMALQLFVRVLEGAERIFTPQL